MALAIEMPLLVKGPTSDQSSLSLLIERAANGDKAAFEQVMINSISGTSLPPLREPNCLSGLESKSRDNSSQRFSPNPGI